MPDGRMASSSEGQAQVHPGIGDSQTCGPTETRHVTIPGRPAGGTSGKTAVQPAPFPGPWATQHPDVRAVFLQGQERTVGPETRESSIGAVSNPTCPRRKERSLAAAGWGFVHPGNGMIIEGLEAPPGGDSGWGLRVGTPGGNSRVGTPGGNSGRELRAGTPGGNSGRELRAGTPGGNSGRGLRVPRDPTGGCRGDGGQWGKEGPRTPGRTRSEKSECLNSARETILMLKKIYKLP